MEAYPSSSPGRARSSPSLASGDGNHNGAPPSRVSRSERTGTAAFRLVRAVARSAPHAIDPAAVAGPWRERPREGARRALPQGHRGELPLPQGLRASRRGGDPASCRPRLGHAARARGRLGLRGARRTSSRREGHRRAGSAGARAPASASPPLLWEAPCSTAARAPARCRSSSAAFPSPRPGACF